MPVLVRASLVWEEAAQVAEARALRAIREGDADGARWCRTLATTFRLRAQYDTRELDGDATPITVVLDPDPTEPEGQPK